MITIMGKATRSVKNLNAWLASKKCPQYADLYRQAGEEFGVRWDMAIFQSCLETGWFWNNAGPFDVKKEQHNYAGLGATGGGVPGDSFPDALTGIRAQLQDLALRCDTFLPKESIISPYARKQYDTISNRHSKHWEDLSGTWAADKNYHTKIYSIMNDFDSKYPNEEEKPMEKITWFEMNRSDAGKPFVTAYAGEKAIFTHPVTTMYEMYTWACKVGSEGANVLVAETDKKVIPKVPDYGSQPNPELTEYIPFATVAKAKMPQRSLEKPKYLIIHWTAGSPDQNGEAGIQQGANNGFTYLFLEGDGDLWQGAPTKAGGYHVGNASVSSFECLGVEVACAGRLEKIGELFVPWFAKNKDGSVNKARCIPRDQVIYDEDGPADDESFSGYYHLYTSEQMKTLMRLALYFCQELGGKPENIRGHDMVATPSGRKVDPGFSVGEGGMTQFRKNVVSALKQGLRWDSI